MFRHDVDPFPLTRNSAPPSRNLRTSCFFLSFSDCPGRPLSILLKAASLPSTPSNSPSLCLPGTSLFPPLHRGEGIGGRNSTCLVELCSKLATKRSSLPPNNFFALTSNGLNGIPVVHVRHPFFSLLQRPACVLTTWKSCKGTLTLPRYPGSSPPLVQGLDRAFIRDDFSHGNGVLPKTFLFFFRIPSCF